MRYYILLFVFIISVPVFSQQSNWESAGINEGGRFLNSICNDTMNDVLYVAGYINLSNTVDFTYILRYINNQWDTMPGFFSNVVRSVVQYKGDIYVGGDFDKVDTIVTGGLAKWDGFNWSKVGDGLYGISGNQWGNIKRLKVHNDTLYAIGAFDSSGEIVGLNSIAKWTGMEWTDVKGIPLFDNDMNVNKFSDIGFYGDEIFVGGNFHGDTIEDFVKFDGENWVKPGIEITGSYGEVDVITTYKGELYIGGNFNMNTNSYMAKYNGTEWKTISQGFSGGGLIPTDFDIYNNELYVSGKFFEAGGITAKYIVKYDGEKWCALGGDFKRYISTLEFYHDTLYVACGDSVDNVHVDGLAKWIGGDYVDTCGIINRIETTTNPKDKLVLYPNPATDKIIISNIQNKNNNTDIEIYYITGKKIYAAKYQNETIEIDIRNYSKGIYLIRISTGEKVVMKKLIINE